MLIPYPFAFLSSAIAFDAAGVARDDDQLGRTANLLTRVGIGTALVAAVPGVIDYFLRVPDGKPKNTATWHMVSNLSALACFTAAAVTRGERARPGVAVLALESVGTAILSVGGWLGGSLSYHHQVGVDPEERAQRELDSGGSDRLGGAVPLDRRLEPVSE